jgi:hypothetical protein
VRVCRDADGFAHGLVVSRRNLLTMLAKLDEHPSGSKRTILAPTQYGRFFLQAEEDEEHYEHESREEAQGVAGRMHPDTERRIRESAPDSARIIFGRDPGDEHPEPAHEPVPVILADGHALLAHQREVARQGIADTVLDPRD